MADTKGGGRTNLAMLAVPRKANHPFRNIKGRLCPYRPPSSSACRSIHSYRSLYRYARGRDCFGITLSGGRPVLRRSREGIFYRKRIGKRATKKRQTPAPIPPRLLAHLHRWKQRRLFTTCFVEFNGKPVQSVKRGFKSAVKLADLPGKVSHPVRIVAFNTAEGWSRDVTVDIAEELRRRLAEHSEISESLLAFLIATKRR